MAEDPVGFIWVGGSGGLGRFDGHRLVQVAADRLNGAVKSLAMQGDTYLWVASVHGVMRRDLVQERMSEVHCAGLDDGVGQLQLHDDAMYALARSGLYRIRTDTLDCQPVSIDGLPAGQPIERFWWGEHGLWLAVRKHGLWHVGPQASTARAWAPGLANTRIRWISSDGQQGLYVGTHRHGLFRLDRDGAIVDHWWRGDDAPSSHAFTTNGVMSLLRMADGRLYAGLWAGGLMEVAPGGEVRARSRPLPHEDTSLGGLSLFALLRASNGTIWIGHEAGLSVLDPVRNQVPWIGLKLAGQSGLDDRSVRALWRRGAELYVGTARGGINRVTLPDGAAKVLRHQPGQAGSLPDNAIWDMAPAGNDHLLVATSGGLARLSLHSLKSRTLAASPDLPSDDVVSLASSGSGGYWLGVWAGGVVRVDEDGHVQRIWGANDGLAIETMLAVHRGQPAVACWPATPTVCSVLEQDGRFHAVTVEGAGRRKQLSDMIAFHQAVDGNLWMGARSGGLALWKPGAVRPTWINTRQFGSIPIYAIVDRVGGGLWLGSDNGLYAVDGSGRVLRHFGKGTGLEFDSVQALFPAVGGRLWVGGVNGVNRIPARLSVPRHLDRTPVVSDVRLFNQPLHPDPQGPLTASPAHGGSLHLRYDQELLTLDFALPGLPQPDAVRFRYRLRGFDRNWVEVARDEARAIYTRLPPGTYQFQVEAGDAQGWGGRVASLPVSVSPPWWMTWWARSILVFVVAMLLLAGHLARTMQLRRQSRRLETMVHERTEALRTANQALQESARTDALTGLPNRRGLKDAIDSHWSSLAGDGLLMLADLDHFKSINDVFGHDMGDKVLVATARCLRAALRADDLVARWGGEEFLCVLPGAGLPGRAREILDAVHGVSAAVNLGSRQVSITAGCTVIRASDTFNDALRRADNLLYEGKRGGRNRVVFDDHSCVTGKPD